MKELKGKIIQWSVVVKNTFNKIRRNRDLLVFFMFLVLSTGLWILNALRKEYTTTISYPVKYTEFPDDFILLGKPQNKLHLKIKSLGYTVLPYHMGRILDPELLNVSHFKRIKNGSTYGAYVATKDLIKAFSDRLANGVELLEIYPDTLFINFEKKERKLVPVRFKSALSFKQQFYQSGRISLKPDSVTVSGPASIVDSLEYVTTEKKLFEDLKDSLIRNVSIQSVKNVVIQPGRVIVSIPVEPFTQKKINVPIHHIHIPDSLLLKSFPGHINISFTVAVSQFNSISASDFDAFVDFNSKLSGALPDRLKVKLQTIPNEIKDVSYTPLFVDCLFEKVSAND